jgi:hypothetical protein
MARPKGSYVSQVFNFGVDKTIPFGFVDVVFDRDGSTVGFEKNGKFYNLGDKVPAPAKKPLTSDQLNKKKNLLTSRLSLLERQAFNPIIGETERNGYIAEFNKTQDELADAEKSFLETQIREGKIKEAEANKKVAETVRLDITRLENRKDLLDKLGKSTFEIDNQIKGKQATLASVQTKDPLANAPTISGPDAARQGRPSSVLPTTPAPTATSETPPPPTGFVQRTPTPGTGTGNKKTSGTPAKPKPGATTPAPAAKKALTIDEIIDAVANEYGSIDTIFKTDPGLQTLLRKAIGKDGVPNTDDDLTVDQFTNELENTDWFKTNASAVRQRGFYKRQFDDLVKKGGNLDDLYKTTEYGRGLRFTQQVIADEIKKVGATLTPEEIDLISRDIYDLGYENQKAIVSQRIRAKIAYKPGGIVGGEAGENLAELRKTAKANGLDLEKNFGSSIQGWLQNLAQGESVETFKQIIRSTAKLGLPEKVSSLIDQGVDLDTIYSPYKRLMASVLEINPETISLDDQVLRSAIGPDKEMSLYDYQKMLRKDNRWQFTNQAKEEVSDTALRVLRDFGFQG